MSLADMTAFDWTTITIASVGCTTGVASLIWNIRERYQTRPLVKVTATLSNLAGVPGVSPEDTVLAICAVNVRSSPITITGFHGHEHKKSTHFAINGSSRELLALGTRLPAKLNEGDSADLMLTEKDMKQFDLKNVEYFFVGDSVRRQWRTKRFPLRGQLNDPAPA